MMTDKTRVALIEDHAEYRDVLEMALRSTPDVDLIGTFGAAEVALRHFQETRYKITPDVVLLDLGLPGMNGLDAIPSLLSAFPDLKVVVLTQSSRENDVMQAMSCGAAGYLLKSSTVDQIVDAIRSSISGHAPLDARVAHYILKTLKKVMPKPGDTENLLTERELEVLYLLAEGLTKKEIAGRLRVSNSTISTHAVHIFEKLSVQNAPAAVAKAFRMGLIPSE